MPTESDNQCLGPERAAAIEDVLTSLKLQVVTHDGVMETGLTMMDIGRLTSMADIALQSFPVGISTPARLDTMRRAVALLQEAVK